MAETNPWLNLLTGLLPPEEGEPMIREGIKELDKFLKGDPHTQERVVDILSRRLSGKVNAETWDLMHDSLRQYFTEDLAYLLYWVVAVENPRANRIKEIEEYAESSDEVKAFFRAVVGIFGVDLTDAFMTWNRIPNNWRTIYREVYFDRIKNRDHIRLRILKYNGEEAIIEGPPDSILSLANELLYITRIVGNPDAFRQDVIDVYLEESGALTKLLKGEEKRVLDKPSSQS